MRFEPKIVRASNPPELSAAAGWTDEEFEARLPGELELLGGQLRDDAARLAAVYAPEEGNGGQSLPYKVNGGQSPPYKSKRKTLVAWSAAGTLASLLLAVAVALPWIFNPFGEVEGGKVAVENQDPVANKLVQAVADKPEPREAGYPASVMPAVFLQNVSGPELEGLFDLWEEDAQPNRISI